MSIINPIVVTAVAALAAGEVAAFVVPRRATARFSTSRLRQNPDPSSFRGPTSTDAGRESDLRVQARDLERLLSTATSERIAGARLPPPPLPDTDDPRTLLGLGLDVGRGEETTFEDVRRAYREMVRVYHPDAAVGPDASSDDRVRANRDFARINAAFEILKGRETAQTYEYSVYVDGEKVTRTVVVSEETRLRDPHRVDYDRIAAMAEHRRRRPKARAWYEEDRDDMPGWTGFETPYVVDARAGGSWRTAVEFDRHDSADRHKDFVRGFGGGPIQSDQKLWDERSISSGQRQARGNSHKGRSRNGWSVLEELQNDIESDLERHRKDGGLGGSGMGFEVASAWRTIDSQRQFSTRVKWWKGSETLNGDFSP
ncbi:hypothetical protein ACHAWF_006049 [Thalassiosira exigua]